MDIANVREVSNSLKCERVSRANSGYDAGVESRRITPNIVRCRISPSPSDGVPQINGDIIARADAGIPVHHSTFEKAERFFATTFPKIDSNDAESKALVVHALSLTGRADFSAANRLYRERQNLSETALAYLTAAFVRMGRPSFAEDLLKILDTKLVEKCRWNSNSQHAILSDDLGTTALALWSYAKLRRDSATTAAVANHVLTQTTRLPSNRSLGAVVAALAEYYSRGERLSDDFTIQLLINERLAGTIKSADLKTTQTFALPP